MRLFIPGNVPSSKNSRQWTGKFSVESKTVKRYRKDTKLIYQSLSHQFRKATKDLPKPLIIGFEFVRGSRRRFDYINPLQTVQDFMVAYGWMEDDNSDILLPRFLPYSYDKEKPGVYITLES